MKLPPANLPYLDSYVNISLSPQLSPLAQDGKMIKDALICSELHLPQYAQLLKFFHYNISHLCTLITMCSSPDILNPIILLQLQFPAGHSLLSPPPLTDLL